MAEQLVVRYMEKILDGVRDFVDNNEMSIERLPGWVDNANVEIVNGQRTTIFKIEPSPEQKDEIVVERDINSDLELYLGIHNDNSLFGLRMPGRGPTEPGSGSVIFSGLREEGGGPVLRLESPANYLFSYDTEEYHSPLLLSEMYLSYDNNGKTERLSYIPLSIYVHQKETEDVQEGLKNIITNICHELVKRYNSEIGDHYDQSADISNSFSLDSNDSVIVLGSYDSGQYEEELRNVRDSLRSNGYSASLIKDLAGNPSKSIRHKAKTWSMGARFVVFVDREPSGHLVEYSDISQEEIITGVLREEGTGSTWLVGHKSMTDDYVELFDFDNKPIEAVEDVCEWAENTIESHIEYVFSAVLS